VTRVATKPTTEARPATPDPDAILDQVIEATVNRVDAITANYSAAIHNTPAPLRRAMLMADGIQKLRQAITPEVMRRFMSLMNTPLGFKTDRPSRKENTEYPESTVKDCVIAGLLAGVFPVGNEMNIISGQCYVTKEGYQRKVKELPGLTDLALNPGVPVAHNGRTVIRVAATWRHQGRAQQLLDPEGKPGRVFALITHESSSADNLVGKATRKALKAIYEQVTGSAVGLVEGEIDELPGEGSSAPASNGAAQIAAAQESLSRADALAAQLAGPAADVPAPAKEAEALSASAAAPSLSIDESALIDAEDLLRERLGEANTQRDFDEIGAEVTAAKDRYGEKGHAKLLRVFQNAYNRWLKAQGRAGAASS
jgi:hypothetical protein